jgi:hypothetical protein
MRSKLLLAIFSFLFCISINAQITFEKNYGDTIYQGANAVKQCFDGGYISTGYTVPWIGQWNVYLVRTDAAGDTLWTRTYGGDDMVGFDVIQTADSNFVLCGYKNSSNPHTQLIKVDANGNTIWTRVFVSIGWGQAVQETFDGGFIVAGYKLHKTDSNGNLLWTKPSTGVQAMYVIQTPDSGYVMAGFTSNNIYLAKTDTAGTTIWTKNYGGTFFNTSNNNLARTTDGGYIIAGEASFGGTLLIKTDANGDTLWTKHLAGDYATSVVQTTDGGYAVGSYSSAIDQMLLQKTDANGIVQWMNDYGFSGSEWLKSIQQTSDGGFILAGGSTSFPPYSDDLFLVKTDSLGNYVGMGITEFSEKNNLLIYPNPFVSSTTLQFNHVVEDAELDIYNSFGQKIKTETIISTDKKEIPRENLPAGIYFISVSENNKVIATGKLMVAD